MEGSTDQRLVLTARVLASLAFLPFIINKIVMNDLWSARFVSWGYPTWGALAITIVEVAAVLGLWVPVAIWYSIGTLVVVLLGAAFTWVSRGPALTAAIPLLVLFFVGLLGFAERKARVPAPG